MPSSTATQRLRVHFQMFRRVLRQQLFAQIVGQLLRMAGVALFTAAHGIHF